MICDFSFSSFKGKPSLHRNYNLKPATLTMEHEWPELDTDRSIGEQRKPRSGLYVLVDSIRTRESRSAGGTLSADPGSDFESAFWCNCADSEPLREDGLLGDDLAELEVVHKSICLLVQKNKWELCDVNLFHHIVDNRDEGNLDFDDPDAVHDAFMASCLHGIIVGPLALCEGEHLAEGETSMDADSDEIAALSRRATLEFAMDTSPFFEISERCHYFCWNTRLGH